MNARESLLQLADPTRDARLRDRSREKIRYELAGAAKDGVEPDESWDVLQEGRDVLALLRERDDLHKQVGELLYARRTLHEKYEALLRVVQCDHAEEDWKYVEIDGKTWNQCAKCHLAELWADGMLCARRVNGETL